MIHRDTIINQMGRNAEKLCVHNLKFQSLISSFFSQKVKSTRTNQKGFTSPKVSLSRSPIYGVLQSRDSCESIRYVVVKNAPEVSLIYSNLLLRP